MSIGMSKRPSLLCHNTCPPSSSSSRRSGSRLGSKEGRAMCTCTVKPCNYLRHDPSVANLLRRLRRHNESSQFIRSHLMPICCIAASTTTQTTLREEEAETSPVSPSLTSH